MEIFLIGSLFFWLLLIAELILLFIFVANDLSIPATLSLLLTAGLLQFAGNVDLLGLVTANPGLIILGVVLYFVAGTVWGVIKWYLYCRDRLEEYLDGKRKWLKGRVGTPEDLTQAWRDHCSRYKVINKPIVSEHKTNILRWMAFWPISLAWSFLDDFVRRVFRAIYQHIAEFLQGVSDRVFAGVTAELEEK